MVKVANVYVGEKKCQSLYFLSIDPASGVDQPIWFTNGQDGFKVWDRVHQQIVEATGIPPHQLEGRYITKTGRQIMMESGHDGITGRIGDNSE